MKTTLPNYDYTKTTIDGRKITIPCLGSDAETILGNAWRYHDEKFLVKFHEVGEPPIGIAPNSWDGDYYQMREIDGVPVMGSDVSEFDILAALESGRMGVYVLVGMEWREVHRATG